MANTGTTTLERTTVPMGSTVVLVVSKGPSPTPVANAPVPDVIGMAQGDALAALQGAGVNAQFFTDAGAAKLGTVIAQWPRPGDLVASGSTAPVLVSAGPPAEGVSLVGVPTLAGQTEAAAQEALRQTGLQSSVVRAFSPTVPEGVVIGQLPEERSVVPKKGTSAWVWVGALLGVLVIALLAFFLLNRPSSSVGTVTVPGVVGKPQAAAEQTLADAGLVVGKIIESPSSTATAGSVMAQDPAKGAEVDKGSKVNLTVATKSDLVKVPDVVGMSKDEAEQALARAQLNVSTTEAASESVPQGDVISQSPKAGQEVPPDTEVGIVISTGPKQVNVEVPNVVGLSKDSASKQLTDAGLKVRTVQTYSDNVPSGNVIGQAPGAGSSVAPGTEIAILVSNGPDPSQAQNVTVPDVVGTSLAEATTKIESAGFKVTNYEQDGTGKPASEVVYQTPAGGDTAPKGSQVILIVSSGN